MSEVPLYSGASNTSVVLSTYCYRSTALMRTPLPPKTLEKACLLPFDAKEIGTPAFRPLQHSFPDAREEKNNRFPNRILPVSF